MLDSLDGLFDVVALIFWGLILATLVIGFVWLGSLPGDIARKRNHPQADAVTALGWVGLLFVVLWPLALAWAFVRPAGQEAAPLSDDDLARLPGGAAGSAVIDTDTVRPLGVIRKMTIRMEGYFNYLTGI